jgi:hypothetical protein
MKNMGYTREQVEAAVKAKGYIYFEDDSNKGYDINIIGIRNDDVGQKVTNAFDDLLTISYKDSTGAWKYHEWPATTDPGKKGVLEYHNAAGVARLVEGQYRGSHSIGLHQGKYEALRQAKNVKVYRDSNRDLIYDETKIAEGVFGINIHKAGADSTYVENWSEGCQVFKRSKDFDEFMKICRLARDKHGNSFTYTLIEGSNIK